MKRCKIYTKRLGQISFNIIIYTIILSILNCHFGECETLDKSVNADPGVSGGVRHKKELGGTQPQQQQRQRESRQISSSSSSLSSTNYDSSSSGGRLRPLTVASSRDSNSGIPLSNDQYYNYNNGVNNNVGYTDPYQLSYSPTAAANHPYYYYYYPYKATRNPSGGVYGSYYGDGNGNGLSDYTNKKTIDLAESNGFFYNFMRDLFPTQEADSKTDPLTLTGLASLVVSSLSGLSWVAIAAIVIIAAPIFIPLVLAPLIFIVLLIYFIPVVKLDIPAGNGRALNILQHLDTTAHFYKRLAVNDECLEQISCQLAKYAKGNLIFEDWITKQIDGSSNKWLHRISRSFKAANAGHSCAIYSCDPKLHLRKAMGSTTATHLD